jgi:hypothetical protein
MGRGNPKAKPPERTEVRGWSSSSIRRNLKFLYSVDETRLTGFGCALTLTVKECPPTGEAWGAMRHAWLERMRRLGMLRIHWVTEWQRRGVPHLHCAIWFPQDGQPRDPLGAWLEVSRAFGSAPGAQHLAKIYDVVGWNQYTSKHAARGLNHYQRSPENVPAGWKGSSSGRVWGKLGDWPIQEPMRLDLSPAATFAFRRIVRGWRVASARSLGDRRRLQGARAMLRAPSKELSACRGVSEWLGAAWQLRVVESLAARGFEVVSV